MVERHGIIATMPASRTSPLPATARTVKSWRHSSTRVAAWWARSRVVPTARGPGCAKACCARSNSAPGMSSTYSSRAVCRMPWSRAATLGPLRWRPGFSDRRRGLAWEPSATPATSSFVPSARSSVSSASSPDGWPRCAAYHQNPMAPGMTTWTRDLRQFIAPSQWYFGWGWEGSSPFAAGLAQAMGESPSRRRLSRMATVSTSPSPGGCSHAAPEPRSLLPARACGHP